MAVSWYVERQGRQLGPFSSAELKGLAASGQLKPHDSVRRADQPKIVAAGKIKGLFPVGEPPARPKTTPPPLPTSLEGTPKRVGPSPTPKGDQYRFEVRPNAKRNATLAAMGCAAFTLGGLWLMASGEQVLAGLLAVLFFGGGGVYAIPKLLRRPVSLVLSRQGIEQRIHCGEATIPWEDVEQIGLVSLHGTKLVGLRLARYDGYLRSMTDELATHMNRFGLPVMKGLSTIASRLEVPSILGLWSVLEGRPDTADALKDFGKVGSLAEAMSWTRQQLGYDITFGWADLDRPAAEFVTLLEQYWNVNNLEPKSIPVVPPPLPVSKGCLDGIGEGINSLTEASKAAAGLAAAQARKAHLVNVTLRAAYLDLGKNVYVASRFRDDYAELFSEIVEIERQIGQFSAARTQDAQPKGLADRASKTATNMTATAQMKALSLKKDSVLRRLGQLSFAKHGNRSGPPSQVQRIADCLSGVEEVDQEILRWSRIGRGRFVTPRRIAIGSLGLLILIIVFVAQSPLRSSRRNDGVEVGPADKATQASTSIPAPSGDGRPAILTGPNGDAGKAVATVRVIDRPLALMKSQYRVEGLTFSPDGTKLIVNQELWHLPTQRRLTQGDGELDFGAAMSFSPDGEFLACVNRSVAKDTQQSFAELRVFRIGRNGLDLAKRVRISTKLSDGFWHTTVWSPRANYLAVVSGEVLVVISDPVGDSQEKMIVHPSLLAGDVNGLGRLVGGFPCYVAGLAFSPDEKGLALAFHEKGVQVVGLPSCKRLATLPFPGADGDLEWPLGMNRSTLGYSSDGRFLVTRQERKGRRDEKGDWVNSSNSLVVWDTTNWRSVKEIEGSGEADKTVAKGFVGLLPKGLRGLIYPDGASPLLLLWDASSGELVELIRPPLIPRRTTHIAWSLDGSQVMFDQVQGPIQIWDLDSKEPIVHLKDELSGRRGVSTLSPDGRHVATGYPNGEVALWDTGAPGRPESLENLAAEAGQTRRDDDRQMELRKNHRPFKSSDISIEQFLMMVQRSGEVKNPRKGLPILVQSKYELQAVLGEPTNVLSSVHEFGRGTHEILDYACSDGRVHLKVTYDLAGAWIKEIAPIRY